MYTNNCSSLTVASTYITTKCTECRYSTCVKSSVIQLRSLRSLVQPVITKASVPWFQRICIPVWWPGTQWLVLRMDLKSWSKCQIKCTFLMAIKTKMHFGDQYCKTIWSLLKVEDMDHINLSLVRLACLAE